MARLKLLSSIFSAAVVRSAICSCYGNIALLFSKVIRTSYLSRAAVVSCSGVMDWFQKTLYTWFLHSGFLIYRSG